jgi:mannose-6-phosphate isomerase class I
MNFNDFEPKTLKTTTSGEQILAQSNVFNLRKVCFAKGDTLSLEAGKPRILSLISGQLTADDGAILQRGNNALLPACHSLNYTANTTSEVLITEDFA